MSTVTKDQVIEKFQELRALMLTGWTQGTDHRDADGVTTMHKARATRHCLHGGVHVVAPLNRMDDIDTRNMMDRHLRGAVGRIGGEGTWSYVNFNDAPGRTVEDIIALIDDTITHIEEHGI